MKVLMDRERNSFSMGWGWGNQSDDASRCFESTGADQEVGQGRLPGRGHAGLSLQDEKREGEWLARRKCSLTQSIRRPIVQEPRELQSWCGRGLMTATGKGDGTHSVDGWLHGVQIWVWAERKIVWAHRRKADCSGLI